MSYYSRDYVDSLRTVTSASIATSALSAAAANLTDLASSNVTTGTLRVATANITSAVIGTSTAQLVAYAPRFSSKTAGGAVSNSSPVSISL